MNNLFRVMSFKLSSIPYKKYKEPRRKKFNEIDKDTIEDFRKFIPSMKITCAICRDYGTYIIFPTLPFLSHASFPFSHMIALMTHLHHHSFFALISTFDPYASSFFLYCYFVPISYSLLLFFYSLLLSFTLALSFLLYLLLIHTLALSFRILALLSFSIAIVLSTLLSTYVYKDQ